MTSTQATISSDPIKIQFSHDPSVSLTVDPSSTTATTLRRHTTRFFDPSKPVSRKTIEECLTLAQYAPSSTNFQPWRLTFVAGDRLEKLRTAMVDTVVSGVKSVVPATPEPFKKYRSELGHELYGEHGYDVPRSDKARFNEMQLRNYRFFDAPLIAVVCVPKVLVGAVADIFSIGLYAETLALLLTERGLGTCWQVAPAGYPQVIKKELDLEGESKEELEVICTLGIGYEKEDVLAQRLNTLLMPRDDWRKHIDFLE